MDVLNVIRDAATPTIPTQTQHLRRTEFDPSILSKLREFLSQKPKGSVRIVGEEGDPGAYSLSQHLADAFKQSGWNVAQGSLDLHFSSGAVFVLDHANEVSKYSNLIREALVASGIAFQRFSMNGTEFTTCTIYVTAQES
jgi:peroxiredoxin